MAEQHFREIQLSGKQLVFLFMTSVVMAVGVFLLGVSVGRGVRADGVDSASLATTDLTPPAELPPPTELNTDDLQVGAQLKGRETPPAEMEPAGQTDSVDIADLDTPVEAVPEPEPSPTRPAQPASVTGRASTPASAPAAPTVKPPAPAAGWTVQVGAYRSRENAETQVQQLKAKGYAAYVASGAPGTLHRVRVGPFPQRNEADRVAARLTSEEGLKPSVSR